MTLAFMVTIGHYATVRFVAVLRTALVLMPTVAACSGDDIPRVADACGLLTREEVSNAVHAIAQPGVLRTAMFESQERLCAFEVSGQLGTVLVYLGHGQAPTNTDPQRATEIRGDTYVIVFAQNVEKDFPEAATSLARLAIHRASRE